MPRRIIADLLAAIMGLIAAVMAAIVDSVTLGLAFNKHPFNEQRWRYRLHRALGLHSSYRQIATLPHSFEGCLPWVLIGGAMAFVGIAGYVLAMFLSH